MSKPVIIKVFFGSLANDCSFERSEDCFAGPALVQPGVAVGTGAGIGGQTDLDQMMQGRIGLSVASPRQAVAVDASGADRDGCCLICRGDFGQRFD